MNDIIILSAWYFIPLIIGYILIIPLSFLKEFKEDGYAIYYPLAPLANIILPILFIMLYLMLLHTFREQILNKYHEGSSDA